MNFFLFFLLFFLKIWEDNQELLLPLMRKENRWPKGNSNDWLGWWQKTWVSNLIYPETKRQNSQCSRILNSAKKLGRGLKNSDGRNMQVENVHSNPSAPAILFQVCVCHCLRLEEPWCDVGKVKGKRMRSPDVMADVTTADRRKQFIILWCIMNIFLMGVFKK